MSSQLKLLQLYALSWLGVQHGRSYCNPFDRWSQLHYPGCEWLEEIDPLEKYLIGSALISASV